MRRIVNEVITAERRFLSEEDFFEKDVSNPWHDLIQYHMEDYTKHSIGLVTKLSNESLVCETRADTVERAAEVAKFLSRVFTMSGHDVRFVDDNIIAITIDNT